jgi:hypothetical protein
MTTDSRSGWNFPLTIDVDEWQKYLNRKLTSEELYILQMTRNEKHFNNMLDDLACNGNKLNLHIPSLTGLYGNCLFESLEQLKLIDNHDEFRKDIAFYMMILKDKKNIFRNHELSLGELFTAWNEIEFVMDKTTGILYKYTYEAMYRDLSNGSSWTRLPTELIMMILSFIFDAKIHIISNTSEYINTIHTGSSTDVIPFNIFLGHIGELHYVPLDINKPDTTYGTPKYAEGKMAFFNWAQRMNIMKYSAYNPYDNAKDA